MQPEIQWTIVINFSKLRIKGIKWSYFSGHTRALKRHVINRKTQLTNYQSYKAKFVRNFEGLKFV